MTQAYLMREIPKKYEVAGSRKSTLFREFLTGQSYSRDNPAEDIIKEKIRFQKASLAQTLNLIQEREKAKEGNLASLASEIMNVQSQLYLYKCHWYPIVSDNRRKGNLERSLSELENRRRQEELDCWKDTRELWQDLLKIAAEYRATSRKAKLLAIAE
jgi:hypothetical protein